MVNGTRSSRKSKNGEEDDLKGSQSSAKKSVNSGAATMEASGVRRRSPRETLSKENMTPSSSSGTRKSERLEKQTANVNPTTPPSKRKSERVEKKKEKNESPLRRSERGKMASSSASLGSKRSDKSLDLLDTKRKKDKKEKSVKQLTMETVEIEQEDEQADEARKKRMDARAYRALFRKQPKKVDGTDHCDDLNGADRGRREGGSLEELTERTLERTVEISTSQSADEALEKNNEHKLFPPSQKDSCKDMSSNGSGPQISKNGLVAGEMNDDAEKAVQENLRSPQLVKSILHGGVLDSDISLEMVQEVMPSERKGHDTDIDSVASPKLSNNVSVTSACAGTSLSSGSKRKDCHETCGMCSKRQRVDCDSTEQEICSCNIKLNQLSGSSAVKERAVAPLKVSKLPARVSSGLDANLDAVNKLCNYWRKGQNAVIFDDQERISNVISSIQSFPSDISRPFLIISTSASQDSWYEEFLHLAPSADIVVYSGSKEIRNSIRNLKFYDEGGCIMFQVLITSPEVVSEDLNVLDCIGWEAIVVDECQRPRIASCSENIRMLTAGKRLLIISSQLKDNVAEYLNLLSLLDSQSDSNGSDSLLMNSSDSIGILKERLAKYVAYECKLESSRFLEYWVPVLLSNVQLEKYCFTLLSKCLSLCSPSKTDPCGVLRDILISSRKCCDHPYLVDQSLQMLLTKGLKEAEFLDVGIKASGKLQLLDAMLWEIKKRELKVLILFQCTGSSGRDLVGDILDDFLRQRFGTDSYERVDGGVIPSKKQSALNRFNNEKERFVFLLEIRARLPSIKLSAVGTVIIFGSDWSPTNDLRALQRITLDSQFEQIKVFRLYSSFTVEEKVLMLSKQDKTIDSNIENISPTSSHMLLKWEASYLFSQLDKFHAIPASDAGTLSEQSHLKDVINEFSIILHQTGIGDDASKLSLILQAKQNQGMYRTEMPLFGEQKIQVINEDPPHTFWTKLLGGKSPRWKYSTYSSQRNRKRVQYFNDMQQKPEAENAEVVKRRKKVVSDGNDHPSPKPGLHGGKLAAGEKEGNGQGSSGTSACSFSPSLSRSVASGTDKIHATSNSLHLANDFSKMPVLKMVEWESRRKQRDLQKNLHVLLKPQIANLCEVLHLKEDVKAMVERFLEYIMNNHLVSREPETILEAFQISLCWSAASLLKQKIDHKESLALAKQHLGFTCKKEEADYVYSMLRCLKRMFLYHTGYLKVPNSPKASEISGEAVSNATSYMAKIDLSGFQEVSGIQAIAESGVAPEFQLAQRDLLKSIKEIQKKCDKQMTKLIEKHKQEMKQFNQKYEEEKAQLENKKRTEAAVIRLHSTNVSMRTDKLKSLDIEYGRKFDELKQQMDLHLKNLEALQVAARSNVLERKTRWVEAVKSWAMVELVKPPVSEANLSEGRSSPGVVQSASGSEVRLSKIVHIVNDGVMACSDPIDKARPFKENFEGVSAECDLTVHSGDVEEQVVKDSCPREQVSVGEIPDEGVLVDVPVTTSSGDATKNVLSLRCSDEHQISDGFKLKMSNGDLETVSPTDAPENFVSVEAPSSEEIPNGATSSKPNSEVPLKAAESVNFCEVREDLASLQAPASEKISDIETLGKVDGETPLRESGTVISSEGRDNFVSLEAHSSVEIPEGSNLSEVDGQVPKSISEIATSCDGRDIVVYTNPSTSKEHISDAAPCSMPAEEVSLAELETVPSEVLTGGNVQRENDGTSPIEIDQQDGIECTMNWESEFQEPSLADPSLVQRVTTSDQGGLLPPDLVSSNVGSLPYASSGVQARYVANNEMQNASQVAETSPCNGTFDVNCNVSNRAAAVVELRDQTQQLRSTEPTSNVSLSGLPSVSTIEHQSSNEGQTANQSAEVPRQNASQVAETSPFNGTIDVNCNMSNPDASVVEIRDQMQQLRSMESTSQPSPSGVPSVSAIEHQLSKEGQSAEAPRQPEANNIELSNQDVLLPLHSTIDGAVAGLVRQASETRTASVPSASNGLPLQTAPAVSSWMPQPLYLDPLQNEMERICKETEQTVKVHEDTKLLLKSLCEKEIEEVVAQIRRKYEVKLQKKEAEFLLQKKELDANHHKVLLNKILAEAFRSKCMDNRASGSAGAQQEASSSFMQQLVQFSSQQMVQQSSAASGHHSTGSVTSVHTLSPAVRYAQTMGPPLQVVNPSALFSGTPTRPPHISSISRSAGNLQIGTEIRAPAPHLQPFRPPPSISPSSLPLHSRGMSSPGQQAHNNHPVASMSLHQLNGNPLGHRQAATTGQSSRIQQEIVGRLAAVPNSSLPSLDVFRGTNNLSGANAKSRSNLPLDVSSRLAALVRQESHVPSIQSNLGQQSGGAIDFVCLSDDD